MAAQGGEEVQPLADGEALAAAVGYHRTDREEELPGADVQHAVAARIDQREDGGGHRHTDAGQARQRFHACALVARGEGDAGHSADPRGGVLLPQQPRAGTLPAAHLTELCAREEAPRSHAAKLADERRRALVLLADQLARQQRIEAWVAQALQRHSPEYTDGGDRCRRLTRAATAPPARPERWGLGGHPRA